MAVVKEDLGLMLETGLLTKAEADMAMGNISTTTDMEECVAGAWHVLEAIPEVLETKQDIIGRLDELCPADVCIASNTSSLRIDECAARATRHPERILTNHYWQPAHLIPLVEVICGSKTSDEMRDRCVTMLRGLRKRVVVQQNELPTVPVGWGNAMQWAFGEKAKSIVDAGCPPQVVDDLIRFGFGRRLAFTAWFYRVDMNGIEMAFKTAKARGIKMWGPYQDMADRGEFGMSSGKGFYDWSGDKDKEFLMDFNKELIHLLKRDMERGDI
jgi:3-hydroxybutyryl-CoA dehydrogenase